ncbi:hypothetical protein HRR83_001675 [Exophiala dermatitidis]|uniref:Uncharacterized protein n=2 Tax=Exophiala dermatitidis TaxID=5970 RepID=H6C5R0_EXODN|nr:uncharacterized protein HMPREF1120_07055 [Exophiala dermatitidis NIH/UT8656]KAJ4516346.1 hypothetical protein HRR73_004809 [Exophiala dermatitidis]EHY59056.1 hypothetical protein HMPREF1120_07055 [Exophiala dermatitidis NIH/UT8656]KAJ4523153.1 hypothetical protein HRR75_001552 [Exophiala dermatitidis]KAJ4526481.1 hypothetical protein HRR74_001679 [Exophiala dermatitidis]KAJ4532273.1 hypothetical protein HRR76_007271 [Exophiala dermatitidis]
MPTRWLSLRHRHPLARDDFYSQSTGSYRQDFDFAFTDNPATILTVPGTTRTVVTGGQAEIRPKTAAGAMGRRRPRDRTPRARPQTSDQETRSPINDASRSEDTLIGLAFGSPSHPPTSFCTPKIEPVPLELSPMPRQQPSSLEKSIQMQSRTWKKFGSLFKCKEPVVKRDEIQPGPTIGLPTGLVVLDKSPTSQTRMLAEHKLQPIQRSRADHDASSTLAGKKPPSNLRHAVQSEEDGSQNERRERILPKLELEIPTAPLDRYSVMFRNLPAATRSSSLLARRSKTLGSLKSFDDNRPTTKDRDDQLPHSSTEESLTPLFPPRRPTTPTSTRSPAGSKYSLFPTTTQTPVRGSGHTAAAAFENDTLGAGQLKRSATSPASLSPMRDEHAAAKPQPLSLRRTASDERVVERTIGDGRPLRRIISHEQLASSPDEHTASTDKGTPWSTAHSLKSSVSSATTVDEIFFDIKSFRDSRGVEDGQFVMTRPASAAVELARTRSKRGVTTDRSQRPQGAQPDEPEEAIPPIPASVMTSSLAVTSAVTTKHTSVNTEYFDEAIAAVERLTSPTITDVVQDVPIMVCDVPVYNTESPGSASVKVFSNPTSISDEGHNFSPQTQPKTTHEVSRLIPSPVVEVKEDLSPNSASGSVATIVPISTPPSPPAPAPPAPAEAPKLPKSTASRVAAVKRVDRPIDDSPTIPQEPPRTTPSVLAQSSSPLTPEGEGESEIEKPPPVPKKDAKYIPLSRYAAKNTVSRIEQAGIIPTRPARANTDNGLGISTSTNNNTTRQHQHPPRTVSLVTKERSSTLPSSLRPPSRPQTESSSTSPSAALRGLEKIVPPPASSSSASLSLSSRSQFTTTTTTGTAEVAVARTVSLSRKQSARVLVPPPRLGQQAGRPNRLEAPRRQTPSPPQGQQQQQQGQALGHQHRRTGSRSLSRDKIKTFMFGGPSGGGEQSQSDSDREKEKEKERARQQLEKQVAMREKEKAKEKEKERDREPQQQVLAIRKKVSESDDNVNGLEQLEPPRQWEILDKSRWEILEKKAYSPVVVQQADRGHRPGLSVGLVVESV